MGGVKRQAYLLKSGDERIEFVGFPPSKCSDKTLLFTASVENFKAFPGETYNPGHISSISELIKEATGTGIVKPKIEVFAKYDTFYDLPRIYTKATFPEQFVTSIRNIISEPTISIRGTYKVLEKEPDPRFLSRNVSARDQNQGPSRARPVPSGLRRFPIFPPRPPGANRGDFLEEMSRFMDLTGNFGPSFIWVPVHNDAQEFSVEGIQLKEQFTTYETFKGMGKMAEYYKSDSFRHAQLKYAVVLEWLDFGMDSPQFERSVLGKLFDGMPLSDCTIVASGNGDTREFQCHRNILGVNSDVLLAMFGSGMQEAQSNRIVMEDTTGDAVELLLQFMYARELDLDGKSEDVILDLMKTAHKYNVEELEKFASQYLCSKPNDWFTMNGALDFCFFTAIVGTLPILTEKLRGIMKMNTQQLSTCTAYQEWMEQEPKEAASFLLKLLEPQQLNPVVANELEREEVQVVEVVDDDSDEDNGYLLSVL